jgi:hypothetical protein
MRHFNPGGFILTEPLDNFDAESRGSMYHLQQRSETPLISFTAQSYNSLLFAVVGKLLLKSS